MRTIRQNIKTSRYAVQFLKNLVYNKWFNQAETDMAMLTMKSLELF